MINKIILKIGLALGVFLLWQTPVLAQESVADWYIKDFKTEIRVNQDSSLDITEKILADCGEAIGKHGIFRVFPKKYQTQEGNFILPLRLISITNENGKNLNYSVSSDSATVTYKIGDPDIEVTGENFYEIKYHVKNAIRTGQEDFDEFYWNILGNYWDLEIDKFSAQIYFPSQINKNNTEIYYYTGDLNRKDLDLATYKWAGDNTLEFESSRIASAGEGITVSVTFPKNIITPYTLTFEDRYGYTERAAIIGLFLFLLFPLITFIICRNLWKRYGQDPRFYKTIVPEFEIPENLSPLEMGGIMKKGRLPSSAITAAIIHLGALGYLRIESVSQKVAFVTTSDFKLIRTDKKIATDLYQNEALILERIFNDKNEVNLVDLKSKFYKNIPAISKSLLNDLDARQLVSKKGNQYRLGMIIIGSIGLFLFLQIMSLSPLILAGLFVSALIILLFGLFMAKLTLKGAELNWRIKGFRLYMNTAEKYRSRFQEQEGTLEKLLPYAILFGITKKWLKKMKDIYGEEYFNSYHPVFMAGALSASNFDSFTTAVSEISSSIASNVSSSSSGSSGGGSSGGGGGGGGGGGW
ncbi:MAG: DUF2207 domain-containing protein [Patescibacteria group bacterium]